MEGEQQLTSAGVLRVLGDLNLLDLFPQRCTIADTILTGDMNLLPYNTRAAVSSGHPAKNQHIEGNHHPQA